MSHSSSVPSGERRNWHRMKIVTARVLAPRNECSLYRMLHFVKKVLERIMPHISHADAHVICGSQDVERVEFYSLKASQIGKVHHK